MTLTSTADLHLGHPRPAANRGFRTVAGHDAAVMSALYELIRTQTRCGFWRCPFQQPFRFRVRAGATLHCSCSGCIRSGNHDAAHPMREDLNGTASCANWCSIPPRNQRSGTGGRTVSLSHFHT